MGGKAIFPNGDADCWMNLKKGDSAALGYLYDTYADKLFLSAIRITDNRELAKDALQEVFVELWTYRETIGDIRHTRSYLTRILLNILIGKLKKEKKIVPMLQDTPTPDLESNKEDHIISLDTERELSSRLQRALTGLTGRQKEILQLHFYEGLTYQQIAEKLSMNYQSVNNLAFRTIRHLRNTI